MHRTDEFRAFFAYHDALMERPGNLTKTDREMIVVTTSSSNQRQYCVVVPGAILRIRAKNPLISDQVAINYRKADITERQKAMLDFALKVSRSAETVGETDFDVLKSHGFDEELSPDGWVAKAARRIGSCLWALSRRKPLAASSMAAPVQRSAILALRQRLTLRQTFAQVRPHPPTENAAPIPRIASNPIFKTVGASLRRDLRWGWTPAIGARPP